MNELYNVLAAVHACGQYGAIDYTITGAQGVRTNYGWLFSMDDFEKWDFK